MIDTGPHENPTAEIDQRPVVLRRALRGIWGHLPTLAVSGLVTGITTLIALYAWHAAPPAVPLVGVALVGPTLGSLCAVVNDVITDDSSSLRSYARGFRHLWLTGVIVSLPIGVTLTLTSVALGAVTSSESMLFLPSVIICCIVSLVLIASLPAAMMIAIARPQLSTLRRWMIALHLTGRWPARFLAPAFVLIAGAALAQTFESTLVLLLPTLWAVLTGCAYWCSAVQLGARVRSSSPRHSSLRHDR